VPRPPMLDNAIELSILRDLWEHVGGNATKPLTLGETTARRQAERQPFFRSNWA
jgi:hypothetical protein